MDLIDYIHSESDDSCALCGNKNLESNTIHHIDGNHDNNSYDNMILLCYNCHCRYHEKKGITLEQINNRKKYLIIKTFTNYGVNALKIAKRNNFGIISFPFLLYHLVDLGFMKKEESQMGYGDQQDATSRFSITEKGKNILNKWSL